VIQAKEENGCGITRLEVVLIRPGKYDDDGYVVRHLRGVLPSNTISCLYALTEAAAHSERFKGRVDIRIHVYDETVHRVVAERIARRLRGRSSRTLVCLAGVQSNQFPRAADLARRFLAAGCKVMIGGFHVSGALAMSKQTPPELQELLDLGVTLVKGEVEDVWGDMLEEVVQDRMQPLYDIVERPDLETAPLPTIPPGYLGCFTFKQFATMDTGRGCPFGCSFCTVINVQGRKMRHRSPQAILERIRANFNGGKGVKYYVFTDDNLARNIHWEKIFDGLIRLRKEEGVAIEFLMQVDVKAAGLPNFVAKAADAGCTQVFVGFESLNPKNLEAAGKTQNCAEDYVAMVEAWHNAGVTVHAAYIFGFPYDTPESLLQDVDRLTKELKVDQASFFLLTPLPGSQDHADAVAAGVPMDSDLNRYDSFHVVWDHPNMTREQLFATYQEAWKRFYTMENMKAMLLRANIHNYWGRFKAVLWYRAAMIEGRHPMLTGFFRLKDRKERRPGFPVDSVWTHWRKRWPEIKVLLRGWVRLFFDLQELWLQTRIPAEKVKVRGVWREHVQNYLTTLRRNLQSAQERINLTVGQVRSAVEQNLESLRTSLPSVSLPKAGRRFQKTGQRWWRRFLDKASLLAVRGISTRRHLDRFWGQTKIYVRRRAYWRINPFLVGYNFLRDVKVSFSFTCFMLGERLF